jgi:predicted ATP-grasp superfamily ATP-dependent carboligase
VGGYDRPSLADIPNPGTRISPGEPVLTILADGHSLAEVEADLRERVASLESILYRETGGS